MNLHSINIPKKKAIIEHQGQLIEVEWLDGLDGNAHLTHAYFHSLNHQGVNGDEAQYLIRNHLASAPKHEWVEGMDNVAIEEILAEAEIDQNIRKMNDETKKLCGITDNIENPSHYQILPGVEVIHVRRALIDKIPSDAPYNAIDEWSRAWEYLTRMWGKNGLEDAKKARVYLNWLIDRMEKAD